MCVHWLSLSTPCLLGDTLLNTILTRVPCCRCCLSSLSQNAAVQKGAETASKAKARVTEQGAQAKQSVGENAGSFFQAMKEEAMKDFQKIAGKK